MRKKYKAHFAVEQSDVTIVTDSAEFIDIAKKQLIYERSLLQQVIRKYPDFLTSYKPLHLENLPSIALRMQEAAEICDVGPMAAVAGALADSMQERILNRGAEIAVIENGGEIALDSKEDIVIALYSLTTILKGQIGFLFKGRSRPIGIGTSSATFGHKSNFGKADVVTIFAENAAIADAAATRVSNEVVGQNVEDSIGKALEIADSLDKISGALINRGKFVGKSGNIPELVSLKGDVESFILKGKIEDNLDEKYKTF